ncbi:MAG: hypothetical protein MRJ68_16090 [Nitrospira sp.]|nr:hypothetical protein [Nitrospira sp.]
MKYQDARARVLNNLLDILKDTRPEENRSTWNSEVGNGVSALSSFADALPSGVRDNYKAFLQNEKRMWEHFSEPRGFLSARHVILSLMNKMAEARVTLDEKWKTIEREDAALDAAIYRHQNEAKDNLKQTIAGLSHLIGVGIGQLGVEGAGKVGELIKEIGGKYLRAVEILRKETAVWKTFVNEREVARKIHEEINYAQIEKAMEDAKNLSTPGDRRDYRVFKDRAISILERHRNKAKEEYEKFIAENKGKFIGSLDTSWFLILVDQDEVNNWMELFKIHTSDLDSLLKKHEEGFSNLKDSDLKKELKENFNKMTNNSREAIVNWRQGKDIYDEYERELKK